MSSTAFASEPDGPVPSRQLLAQLVSELSQHAPFVQMEREHVERFVQGSRQAYYEPGETVATPADGPATHLMWIRQGSITGRRGMAEWSGGFQYDAGDLFPVGAVMGARPVTATYQAHADTFCLLLPVAEVRGLAAQSAPFADFLNRRVLQYLELSRRALQVAYSSQTLAEQSLEKPLAQIGGRVPVTTTAETPLSEALATMHERHIGSMLVVDSAGAVRGILTRHDILGRVTLAQLPLDTPIATVMTTPVHTLTTAHTAQDAAVLMSRHAIRHVPVTEGGRLVNIVSERDLFAMQRLSLKQVSTAIRASPDVETLRAVARDIRRFARNLLGQGVGARQLTELVSHLNDVLTEHLVDMLAAEQGVDLQRCCWLAFGSEGRAEQTVATDQDNGLVFVSDEPARDRPQWLAFARSVNLALDACGYPLCRGGIMASNPHCCLTVDEWCGRFNDWMEHGAPDDLLKASIFFDLRPIAGRQDLAEPLRRLITQHASRLPRFMKQMSANGLRHRVPLNWLGGVEAQQVKGREVYDAKLHGTAIFVDVARLYALAHGTAATNTRERFLAIARWLKADPSESEAWVGGFEFLQMLRLRRQMEEGEDVADNPNLVDLNALNEIDRRVLRETLRVARRLQQRMEMDYQR